MSLGLMHRQVIAPRWSKAARTQAILALADKMEPRMRNAFLRAVSKMRGQIDLAALTQAIANNDRLLAYDAVFEKQWPKVLADTAKIPVTTYQQSGSLAAKGLARIGIETSFNLKSPEAIQWARTYSSSLITQISNDTRKGVQSVIGSALDIGIPPKEAARVIRDMVGLTERQGIAAWRYREMLLSEDRPADQIGRMADRYEAKLLKSRGETIARTEIMTAANQGQQEAWQQAVEAGLLNPKTTNREWIVANDDRLCELCAPMSGQIVGFTGAFESEDGGIDMPPLHPNCRCTIALSEEERTAQ